MVSLDASHREVRVWSGFVYVEVGWRRGEERKSGGGGVLNVNVHVKSGGDGAG